MDMITITTAASISSVSKRTLWRRISDAALSATSRGARDQTMLNIDDVLPLCVLEGAGEERALIIAADRGDPEAQSDLAMMLLEQGQAERAIPWLARAAGRFYPDAMYTLGRCLLTGEGVAENRTEGADWIQRAGRQGFHLAMLIDKRLEAMDLASAPVDEIKAALDRIERAAVVDALTRTADAPDGVGTANAS